jgi:formate dehydrogenase subunit delta
MRSAIPSPDAQGQPYQHDHAARLVRMANQIGAFFESQRVDLRIPGVAEHIGQFWDKKMRRDIYDYLDQGGEDLSPMVIAALQHLRSMEKTIGHSQK